MGENLKSTFFALLKCGLWGSPADKLADDLTTNDWESLYNHALKHTVEGVIFDSFASLLEHQLPPKNILVKWAVRVDQIERSNKKMNNVINRQWDYFCQLGVNATLLKGQGVARCYKDAARRVCGDVDWVFEGDGYNTVLTNIRKDRNINFPLNSFGCEWAGVQTDFHRQFFDIFNPFKAAYIRSLLKEHWRSPDSVKIEQKNITILRPELQLLQVNVHILKHMFFLGVGLRQFCDSARLYYEYRNSINLDLLRNVYVETGILKWIHILHQILVEYIGLPQQYIPFPYPNHSASEVEKIVDEIWQSGNFGFHDLRYGMAKERRSKLPNRLVRIRKSFEAFKLYYKYAPGEALFFSAQRVKAGISHMAATALGARKPRKSTSV